jgi:predicted flap endonuclease-1-like 5' DNA nuclease
MTSLSTIEGIGPKYNKMLLKCNIKTSEKLLKVACDRKGRRALSSESGCTEKQLLEWVNRADLMRVRGVGEEYSDLLERAGVDTIKELRKRKPVNLHKKMHEVNSARRVHAVRRPPSLGEVERWVAHAGELDPVVSH